LQAFPNFSVAAQAVLRFLHERTGFDLWMVTRTEGDDWIVLDRHDQSYGVEPGQVFRWADSFCSRMVAGEGPRTAPDCQQIPAYASAPIAGQIPIGAYLGVPLSRPDGTLFGTLCGVHPQPKSAELHRELPLVELLAQLLSGLLIAELNALHQTRRAERAESDLMTDALTGLFNRRGWDALVAAEESRCKRYGSPACVLSIDLDELKEVNDSQGHASGDELLKSAARVLLASTRQQDVVARVGGDEFAVLAVECDVTGGDTLVERLIEGFHAAGVKASIGMASRTPLGSLLQAWQESDKQMYFRKRDGRAANLAS
jgi:diguanylate cyclase (GGDEF)-like protein